MDRYLKFLRPTARRSAPNVHTHYLTQCGLLLVHAPPPCPSDMLALLGTVGAMADL